MGKALSGPTRYLSVESEFTEFYLAARDECLRVVLVGTGDRDLAEDLVAEAFARAWRSWAKVREHPSPRAWIVRTALNAGVSSWRRHRREISLAGYDAPGTADSAVTGLDLALTAAISRLPLRQRQVLLLRIFFDLDTTLTAGLLGIAPATVSVHLHRALATLRSDYLERENQEAIG